MADPRTPIRPPPPPPDPRAPIGAVADPHATSIVESRIERDARLAAEAAAQVAADPRPVLPEPASMLGQAPSELPGSKAPDSRLLTGHTVAWTPKNRASRILPKPIESAGSAPTIPITTAKTLDGLVAQPEEGEEDEGYVPDEDVHVSRDAPVRVVIDVIRPTEQADMRWAVPRRVGNMFPPLQTPGGPIPYCVVLGVKVEDVKVVRDIYGIDQCIVHVTACYSPNPGKLRVRYKFNAKNKRRLRQLHAALTVAFAREPAERGLVLHLVSAPPTMGKTDPAMADYPARAGKGRAPVRAMFSREFVESQQRADKKLHEDVQRYLPGVRQLFLAWLWCSGWFWGSKNHEILASYTSGGAESKAVEQAACAEEAYRKDTERQVATLGCWPMTSLSTFVWENKALREALVARGEDVSKFPETLAGTGYGKAGDEEQ